MVRYQKNLGTYLLNELRALRFIFVMILAVVPLSGCDSANSENLNRELNAAVKIGMPQGELIRKLNEIGFKCDEEKKNYCYRYVTTGIIESCPEFTQIVYTADKKLSSISAGVGICSEGGK